MFVTQVSPVRQALPVKKPAMLPSPALLGSDMGSLVGNSSRCPPENWHQSSIKKLRSCSLRLG